MKTTKIFLISLSMIWIFLPTIYAETDSLCILFFNDLHGHLQSHVIEKDGIEIEVGGIARIASLVKKITDKNKAKNIPTFVVIAGDILQGTPLSTVFKGEPDIKCFNEMNVVCMTVGNHEFDFGIENFKKLKNLANFPFISSNIFWKDTNQAICPPSKIIEFSGRRIHIVGVTTEQLLTTTKPSNVRNISIENPTSAVKAYLARIPATDPVVLLSHCRAVTDQSTAEALPQITAIIGGHDQILLNPCKIINKVPIFQAFEKGKYLGRLDVKLIPNSSKAIVTSWDYIPINSEVPEDSKISNLVNKYVSLLDDRFKEIIGHTTVFLDGERDHIRYEETNLGNFFTDIMRQYTNTDIALLNSGAIRASIPKGPIKVADVFKAFPYANEIVLVKVTGKTLLQILNRSVRGDRQDEDGGFLHVSGMSFLIDENEPVDVTVQGQSLIADQTYRVAITDFMAEGGDQYTMFDGKVIYKTGSPLRELIVDKIAEMKTISPKIENRIVRKNRNSSLTIEQTKSLGYIHPNE